MPGPYVGNPFAGRFGDTFQAAINDPEVRGIPGGLQQYIWSNIREDFPRGSQLPPGAFQAVNQLLSLAGQQRQAELALARAVSFVQQTGIDQSVDVSFTAPHLDTRALNEMVLGPQHRVVYLTEDLVNGEPVLSYKTHDFGYNLPQSISALQDVTEEAAQLTAADYGYEWNGTATPVAIYSY